MAALHVMTLKGILGIFLNILYFQSHFFLYFLKDMLYHPIITYKRYALKYFRKPVYLNTWYWCSEPFKLPALGEVFRYTQTHPCFMYQGPPFNAVQFQFVRMVFSVSVIPLFPLLVLFCFTRVNFSLVYQLLNHPIKYMHS